MNLKLQAVIDKFGLEAYGYYFACIELVAKEGVKSRIKSEKNWKIYFKKFLNVEIDKQDTWLRYFAELNLIGKKALEIGDLFAPKMEEYSDEYTKKRRRVSGHDTDNIPLQHDTTHNITTHNNTVQKNTYGEFEKVKLTTEEYDKLVERLGEANTQLLVSELDSYIASKNKKYSSHYATILSWARRKFVEHKEKVERKTKTFITWRTKS